MTTLAAEFDLFTDPRAGYLYARLHSAALTPDIAEELLRELRVILLNTRRWRVMLEYEVAFALTEAEAVAFVNRAAKVLPSTRIAFVAADSRHEPSLAFGAAAGNSSGSEYRVFTKAAEAEEWLLTESD